MANRGGSKRRSQKKRNKTRRARVKKTKPVKRSDMRSDHSAFCIDLVCGNDEDKRKRYSRWADRYIERFKTGDREFAHWYAEQRRLEDSGDLGWPIPYLHEIFPETMIK